jgi:deazaflavin-dependent oxidoreductase (nitroreductase family)
MEAPVDVIDSTEPWVKKQIDEYVATNGEKPVFRYNSPLLLITYQGRKTGQWRRTCLIGAEYQGSYLLVASKGGADDNPLWYPNLVENPTAWLQVGPNYFPVTARTASPDEKPERWDYMVSLYPDYADYQKKTERDIPIVILDPIPTAV